MFSRRVDLPLDVGVFDVVAVRPRARFPVETGVVGLEEVGEFVFPRALRLLRRCDTALGVHSRGLMLVGMGGLGMVRGFQKRKEKERGKMGRRFMSWGGDVCVRYEKLDGCDRS